ncbi:MAG: DUF6364 family protein [Phycisphaerae bacterium]|nr:DUF6364 family protein [Phycisphaerae bacterium]
MKKLTLSMEERDIRTARRLAQQRGTSISKMFSELLRVMARSRRDVRDLPPITRRLGGVISLPGNKTERELIEEALAERHGPDT